MARLNLICYAVQPVDAGPALMILAGFAPRMEALAAAGLRFRFTQDGRVRFRLPVEGQVTGAGDVRALAQELYQKIAEANGTSVARAAPDPSEVLDDALLVPRDVLAMVPFACPFFPDRAPPLGHRKLLLIERHDGRAAEAVAGIVRAGRDLTLAALDGAGGEARFVATFFDDDPRDMALSAGLLASDRLPSAARLLVAHDVFSGRLYLPPEYAFSEAANGRLSDAVATLLDVLASKDAQVPVAHVVLPSDAANRVSIFELTEDAAETVETVFEGQRVSDALWSVDHIRLDPSPEAVKALVDRIVAQEFKLGYRPRLDELSKLSTEGGNAELLREQIFELQAELDLLSLDQLRQQRLLRFTDAQLGALVDGLRRLPKPLLDQADLRYGAHHAAGRAGPIHFILYNMADLPVGSRLPEDYWRGATDDHPIIYHLDPYCADALERRDARSRIFVPVYRYLSPSLGDFGGSLDETLKMMVGPWFSQVSTLFDAPDTEPAVLFSPTETPGFDLEVECLDLAQFQPVALRLPWINDYLQTRDSTVVEHNDLAAVARDLYTGDAASAIAATVDATLEETRADWTAGIAALQADVATALEEFRNEIAASTSYLRDGFTVLDRAARHISEMEVQLRDTSDLLRKADQIGSISKDAPQRLAADRTALIDHLTAELAIGDRVFAEAEERLATLRRRMGEIRQWGRKG